MVNGLHCLSEGSVFYNLKLKLMSWDHCIGKRFNQVKDLCSIKVEVIVEVRNNFFKIYGC